MINADNMSYDCDENFELMAKYCTTNGNSYQEKPFKST